MSKKFEDVFEVFAWLRIVASPLIIGCILGFAIYFQIPGIVGFILGICVTLIGLVIGVLWGNSVWKKQGPQHFMSRISASEDLDPKEKQSEKNN